MDREDDQMFQARLAGIQVDGGASGSGLSSFGPSTTGATPGFLKSIQMNLELNARARKN